MIAASDFDKDRYAFYAAKATYAKAKADLERILAGSWKEDIDIARAAVQLAQSQVDTIKTNLERLTSALRWMARSFSSTSDWASSPP